MVSLLGVDDVTGSGRDDLGVGHRLALAKELWQTGT
jgi:hypothetical protein